MSLNKVAPLSARLKEALEDTTVTDLASRIGMSKQAISTYVTGLRVPKRPVISAISEALDLNPMWLMGYDVPKKNEINPSKVRGVRIPVLGKVEAGIPIEAVEDILDEEEIAPEVALKGEYFALKIKGHSMEPRIAEGDVVIVRRQSDVESGDVAVVLVNGSAATVKKIEKRDDGIMLIGYNTLVYSPKFYTNKEIRELPIEILGKVVELRGKF